MTSKIIFKDGTALETTAVYSSKEIIEGAYREKFEIRFPETVSLEQISAAATQENLAEITLKEFDENGAETGAYLYRSFTMVRGIGFKAAADGARYNELVIARLSELEITQQQQAAELAALQEQLNELLAK